MNTSIVEVSWLHFFIYFFPFSTYLEVLHPLLDNFTLRILTYIFHYVLEHLSSFYWLPPEKVEHLSTHLPSRSHFLEFIYAI